MKLNKIFKWCMVLLIVISAALAIWAAAVGFTSNDGQPIDVMLYWAYVLIGIALVSWVVIGGIVLAKDNPKGLLGVVLGVVALAVVCLVAYLIASGSPIPGRDDAASTLKLTDTVLNLIYLLAALTVAAIVAGEVRLAIKNRK